MNLRLVTTLIIILFSTTSALAFNNPWLPSKSNNSLFQWRSPSTTLPSSGFYFYRWRNPYPDIPPRTASDITVHVAPVGGIIVNFKGNLGYSNNALGNHYLIKRKIGSQWRTIYGKIHEYRKNYGKYFKYVDSLTGNHKGIQYKIGACTTWLKCTWSRATHPVNMAPYNRDINDSDGSEIRDDAEAIALLYTNKGSAQYTYAMHYAFYLQRLLGNSYGATDFKMHQDFFHMAMAKICAGNHPVIQHVHAVLLDSKTAFTRFNNAQDEYATSSYGTWRGPSQCTLSTTKHDNSGLTTYQQSRRLEVAELSMQRAIQNKARQIKQRYRARQQRTQHRKSNKRSNRFRNIIYINGMDTTESDAKSNRAHIEKQFMQHGAYVDSIVLSYNHKPNFWMEFAEALLQYATFPNAHGRWYQAMLLSEKILGNDDAAATQAVARKVRPIIAKYSNPNHLDWKDMVRLRWHINERPNTDIVLLAHSQGNFFANKIWVEKNDLTGNAANYLRVYGLGTPASFIPHNGHYYTNYFDVVINAIRSYGHVTPLPANINLFQWNDLSGHKFIKTYMPENAPHTKTTVDRIMAYFDDMTPRKPTQGECRGYSHSGNGTESLYYNPSNNGFWGTLSFTRNSYRAANSYTIMGQDGSILLATSFESGRHTARFNYDHATHGQLTIIVNHVESGDAWNIQISCPTSTRSNR